jgi:Zn-dependent M28 family amino/carboxypeptidase
MRFVAFADEESWCVGSTNYVARHESELDRIALMVNVDGIARYSGTHLRLGKREDVTGFLRTLVAERKLPLILSPSDWLPGSSDDWPFLVTGVPSTFCTSMRSAAEQARGRGLDHTQGDTVDKIDDLRARQASMVLTQFLAAVADSPERPGPKLERAEMFRRLEAAGAKQELVDQGRWHPESVLGVR